MGFVGGTTRVINTMYAALTDALAKKKHDERNTNFAIPHCYATANKLKFVFHS